MDRVLGGDIIVEQNIHVIDVTNWLLNGHPLKAHGAGGRSDWSGTKYDAGDAYDHFAVTYWYPNDVVCSFSSNQLTNSFSDLCVRCFGIKGCADTHYGGLVRITGENAWLGAEKDDTFRQGAINNVKAFVESIRTGKLLNNAERGRREQSDGDSGTHRGIPPGDGDLGRNDGVGRALACGSEAAMVDGFRQRSCYDRNKIKWQMWPSYLYKLKNLAEY